MFAVPTDSAKAAELALRDARDRQEAWRLHGIARRLTDRVRLADTAYLLEHRIIETANALIAHAVRGGS